MNKIVFDWMKRILEVILADDEKSAHKNVSYLKLNSIGVIFP